MSEEPNFPTTHSYEDKLGDQGIDVDGVMWFYNGYHWIRHEDWLGEVMKIEGNIMDMENRIKYDDKVGTWKVIFNGKVTTDQCKTSGDAYNLMQEFIRKSKEPKY